MTEQVEKKVEQADETKLVGIVEAMIKANGEANALTVIAESIKKASIASGIDNDEYLALLRNEVVNEHELSRIMREPISMGLTMSNEYIKELLCMNGYTNRDALLNFLNLLATAQDIVNMKLALPLEKLKERIAELVKKRKTFAKGLSCIKNDERVEQRKKALAEYNHRVLGMSDKVFGDLKEKLLTSFNNPAFPLFAIPPFVEIDFVEGERKCAIFYMDIYQLFALREELDANINFKQPIGEDGAAGLELVKECLKLINKTIDKSHKRYIELIGTGVKLASDENVTFKMSGVGTFANSNIIDVLVNEEICIKPNKPARFKLPPFFKVFDNSGELNIRSLYSSTTVAIKNGEVIVASTSDLTIKRNMVLFSLRFNKDIAIDLSAIETAAKA